MSDQPAVIVTTGNGIQFELRKDEMVERGSRIPYSAFRIDLRDAWLHPKEVRLTYTYPHVDGGRATTTTEVIFGEDEVVHIGCKVFHGENYRKLREWILKASTSWLDTPV